MNDRVVATFPRRSKTGAIEEVQVGVSTFTPTGRVVPIQTIGIRVWYMPLDRAGFLPSKVGINLRRAELAGVIEALQKIEAEFAAERAQRDVENAGT